MDDGEEVNHLINLSIIEVPTKIEIPCVEVVVPEIIHISSSGSRQLEESRELPRNY